MVLGLDKSFTEIVHDIVKNYAAPSDNAIDCTVGNGGDTVFLARLLPYGHIYGFDIQNVAIDNTYLTLQALDIKNVTLYNDCHSNIGSYQLTNIKCGMYNLGYLPKTDHKVITRPETTIASLSAMSKILVPGGVISIICYCGHKGGLEEKRAVEYYMQTLNIKKFIVAKLDFFNRPSNPPMIYIIEKRLRAAK